MKLVQANYDDYTSSKDSGSLHTVSLRYEGSVEDVTRLLNAALSGALLRSLSSDTAGHHFNVEQRFAEGSDPNRVSNAIAKQLENAHITPAAKESASSVETHTTPEAPKRGRKKAAETAPAAPPPPAPPTATPPPSEEDDKEEPAAATPSAENENDKIIEQLKDCTKPSKLMLKCRELGFKSQQAKDFVKTHLDRLHPDIRGRADLYSALALAATLAFPEKS